jgi:hypothetical protein
VSVRTKAILAGRTVRAVDDLLKQWQEAFGRGDLDARDCGSMINALLDVRCVGSEWGAAKKREKTEA